MGEAVSHSVPASAAGIIFQFERALLHLARSGRGSLVGIETCDDVAVKTGGQLEIWEQDKLSLQDTGHPLQDRSKNLWNTLWIWLKKLSSYTGPTDSVALYLVTNRPVPNCLARSISDAQDAKGIRSCIRQLRTKGTSEQSDVQAIMAEVLKYPEDALARVVRQCRLFDANHPLTAGTTRQQLADALQLPPEISENTICDGLAGWLQEAVMAEWRVGRDAWITFEKFNRRKFALIWRFRNERVREFPPNRIFWTKAQEEEARLRNFVAHLVNVNADRDQLTDAVTDYLRFSTEYSRLLEAAEVDGADWQLFFDDLKRRWRSINGKSTLDHPQLPPEKRGLRVLLETTDPTYKADLGGEPTTYSYLTSGGYHRLADDDEVWWHPEYEPQTERGDE